MASTRSGTTRPASDLDRPNCMPLTTAAAEPTVGDATWTAAAPGPASVVCGARPSSHRSRTHVGAAVAGSWCLGRHGTPPPQPRALRGRWDHRPDRMARSACRVVHPPRRTAAGVPPIDAGGPGGPTRGLHVDGAVLLRTTGQLLLTRANGSWSVPSSTGRFPWPSRWPAGGSSRVTQACSVFSRGAWPVRTRPESG